MSRSEYWQKSAENWAKIVDYATEELEMEDELYYSSADMTYIASVQHAARYLKGEAERRKEAADMANTLTPQEFVGNYEDGDTSDDAVSMRKAMYEIKCMLASDAMDDKTRQYVLAAEQQINLALKANLNRIREEKRKRPFEVMERKGTGQEIADRPWIVRGPMIDGVTVICELETSEDAERTRNTLNYIWEKHVETD